jgi:hypothetical protein
MNLKYFILASASVAALSTISVPALAAPQTVNANQWYTVGFGTSQGNATVGNALGGISVQFLGTGSNGPVLPSGAAAAGAVALTATTWSIFAPAGGYLTITDVENSGDQFQLTDNGDLMGTTTGGLGGQNGQNGGLTSNPGQNDNSCGDNIGCALSDSNYSSGTFVLQNGANLISATEYALAANSSAGDADFIIELNASDTSVPEPISLSLLGVGAAGLAAVRRRRTKAA